MSNAKAKQDRELTDDAREKPATIVPFAPMPKGQVERNIVVDDSGRAIHSATLKVAGRFCHGQTIFLCRSFRGHRIPSWTDRCLTWRSEDPTHSV